MKEAVEADSFAMLLQCLGVEGGKPARRGAARSVLNVWDSLGLRS